MAVIKYKSEDVIPIVASVLSVAMVSFVNYVFKIALEGEFADLKGLVSIDEYDECNSELLSQLDDELTVSLAPCLQDFQDCLESFTNIYALSLEDIFTDERITAMADDIFLSLCYDTIEPNKDRKDAILSLMWFFYAILGVLELLCILIEKEELDLESIEENPDDYYDYLILDRPNSENPDINRLIELGVKLNSYNDLLVGLD